MGSSKYKHVFVKSELSEPNIGDPVEAKPGDIYQLINDQIEDDRRYKEELKSSVYKLNDICNHFDELVSNTPDSQELQRAIIDLTELKRFYEEYNEPILNEGIKRATFIIDKGVKIAAILSVPSVLSYFPDLRFKNIYSFFEDVENQLRTIQKITGENHVVLKNELNQIKNEAYMIASVKGESDGLKYSKERLEDQEEASDYLNSLIDDIKKASLPELKNHKSRTENIIAGADLCRLPGGYITHGLKIRRLIKSEIKLRKQVETTEISQNQKELPEIIPLPQTANLVQKIIFKYREIFNSTLAEINESSLNPHRAKGKDFTAIASILYNTGWVSKNTTFADWLREFSDAYKRPIPTYKESQVKDSVEFARRKAPFLDKLTVASKTPTN
jgi:hypothetical protein